MLEVADQGPGVPPDQRSLVFERFYRGMRDDHLQRPGAGIGLAVVKDLAERMGGSVDIMDAPAAGALFRVDLPLAALAFVGAQRLGPRQCRDSAWCPRAAERSVWEGSEAVAEAFPDADVLQAESVPETAAAEHAMDRRPLSQHSPTEPTLHTGLL